MTATSAPSRYQSSKLFTASECRRSCRRGLQVAERRAIPAARGERVEGEVDVALVQSCAEARDEKRRADRAATELVSPLEVAAERLQRRRVQGHEPRLLELGVADDERALLSVEVVRVEGDRLADPKPAHAQQPDEGLISLRPERRAERSRRFEQRGDLGGRVQVGGGATRPVAHHRRRRHLHLGVDGLEVGGEPPHGAQPDRPPVGRGLARKRHPLERLVDRDRVEAVPFEVGDELAEQPPGGLELEPEGVPKAQVVFQRAGKRPSIVHRGSPGQGRAIPRNARWSTFYGAGGYQN